MIGVMENSKIEQVEVERFKSLFLRGIAFIFWFPGIILMELPLNKLLMTIVAVISSVFGILFIYAAI